MSDPSVEAVVPALSGRIGQTMAAQGVPGDEILGPQVLAGRTLSEMHRVAHVEADWSADYALSWMAVRLDRNIYLNHGGSVPGFLSIVAFNKPARLGVVVLSNKQGNGAASATAYQALEAVLAEDAKRARPAAASAPVPTPAALKPMLGRYASSPVFGIVLQIELRNGALVLVTPPDPYLPPPPPAAPLTPTEVAGVFTVVVGRPAGEALTFDFAADGSVIGFTLGENGTRLRKID